MNSSPRADREESGAVEGLLARMGPAYAARFAPEEVGHHAELLAGLSADRLCRVEAREDPEGGWRVTVAAFDFQGELSILCGLFAAEGLSVLEGNAFTESEPARAGKPERAGRAWWRRRGSSKAKAPPFPRRRIVDTFRVVEVEPSGRSRDWPSLERRLDGLLALLLAGGWKAARESLIEPVCATLRRHLRGSVPVFLPLAIGIENDTGAKETLVRIRSADTPAFLFQLLTAFAMRGLHVRWMRIETRDGEVRDELAVTGRDLAPLDVEREGDALRAAVALVKRFTHVLPLSPDPELALGNFGQFLDDLLARTDWSPELASLERPEALAALAKFLGMSEFLWEDFLRLAPEEFLPLVISAEGLEQRRPKEEMARELADRISSRARTEKIEALNAWKDREMFRIETRHISGRAASFREFSAEMSDMADVAVRALFDLVREDRETRHGRPRLEDGRLCRLCLAGLGKFGGQEMGCASDVELLFLYEGEGRTDGQHPLGAAQFACELATDFAKGLFARRQGIFEVDLRLRPYGEGGPLATSADAFLAYYGPGGPAPNLQRQALVKLRPVAGDADFGLEVVRMRDRVLYEGEPLDIGNLLHLRERQASELVPRGETNAKFSPGGLVDVEYTVQALQAKHAREDTSLRSTNTLSAILALAGAGRLDATEAAALDESYRFLRRLVDAMRIVRGLARDLCLPPSGSEELARLARRMGYAPDRPEDVGARLAADLARTMAAVRDLSRRILDREFPRM
ncbi:MAG: hypothetical protein HY720_32580 [Planctomycetes bacterium]|nr:hypothetical protein [Planctomycetota bacterium]